MPNFGPTQVLTPAAIQELIRSGAYAPEDFGLISKSTLEPQGPNYNSGSSAAQDQRSITGETPLQQRQRQDAQLKALLEARKRKGYAGGGAIVGGLGRLAKHLSGDAPAKRGVSDIIKETGGQWLSGSYGIDNALKRLRLSSFGMEPSARLAELDEIARTADPETLRAIEFDKARQRRNAVLNSFVDKQLKNYVQKDMATEKDPVRKLAEQGILHVYPEQLTYAHLAENADVSRETARTHTKFAAPKVSTTDTGSIWEDAADAGVYTGNAAKYRRMANEAEINPWLTKLDDSTPVHEINYPTYFVNGLGLDHLMDELGNAIDPASDLPQHLKITPDQLKSGNFSMDAAVRHVAKINEWRDKTKAEADLVRANNAATVLHKDYPDKGFKWVELRQPELPEGFKKSNYKDFVLDPDGNELVHPGKQQLADALKYEGETMGHCVGGYCEDVASGRSRIYSLRDAKGQPHVTVEVTPPGKLVPITEEMRAERGYLRPHDRFMDIDTGYGHESDQVYPNIVQIKGKGNAKPKDDYIPFVQDFIKSGQWSEVGDLRNADLIPRRQLLLSGDEEGKVVGDYFTKAEYDALNKSRGFASGGLIGLNPRKPLELTVTPDDVLHGNEVDENNAASANQAYNESRERMMAARREDAIAARKLSAIDEIMAELPSSLYVPPPELSASSADPAYSSMEDAVKTMGDWRLGIGQAIASPLLVTDAAEAGLDALRGVKSPSRFRQVSNAISKAFGGPEESANRLEGPHDMQALAASLVNPGNLVSMAKLPKAMMATRGIPRLLKGHSAEAITAPAAQLRQIKDYDDFHKQVSDLSRVQDLRGRHLLGKGASIPDLTTDYLYNWENGGKVYEVLPGPRNKRGWASIAPTEAGKPAYISGIMAEEPGSKDFVNGTFNALLNEIKGPAHATAANGALARYYKSKGIKVGDNWDMNFAKGGKVAPLPAKMRPCDCKPKAMAAGGSVDEEILKLHGY